MSAQPPTLEYGADEISALVLDPGASVTRAGFAGEDTPKSVIPTQFARAPGSSEALFDDSIVFNPFPGADIASPIGDDGTVVDWETAAKLWEYAITSRLTGRRQTSALRNGLNDSKDENGNTEMKDVEATEEQETLPMAENPLLVTEPSWNSSKNREKTIELAMEGWGVPAFWLGRAGVLSAFSSGKSSALVIDIGASQTSVSCMHDGLQLKKSVQHSNVAGDFLSDQIRLLFQQAQPQVPIVPHYLVQSKTAVDTNTPAQAVYRSFATPPTDAFRRLQEERVLTEFKENVVQVWLPEKNPGQTLANSMDFLRGTEANRPFEMPDGWNSTFGPERFRPTEGMFDEKAALTDPSYSGITPTASTTIPALIKASLAGVDTDLKPTLLANAVVVGGTSLTSGLVHRIDSELRAQFPALRVRVQAPGNVAERRFASWIGGSILASLGTFHQMWVSKKEYEEHGPGIVEKRCK